MLRAILLIFDPVNTWDRIEKTQHGILRVFIGSIFPLLVLTSAIESYGLITFGREHDVVGRTKPVSVELVTRYETAQFALAVLLLFGGSWLLRMIGQGFHRKHSYGECFATAAYSLSPLFLLRVLNAIPAFNLWITWAVGIFLSVAALYRGIPRLMKPDPTNALGLYLMATLVFILASGLANFIAILVLEEKVWAA